MALSTVTQIMGLIAFLSWACVAAEVAHRPPRLSAVFPQGGEPGSVVQAEVLGERLDRVSEVVIADPTVQARVLESTYTKARLEFIIGQSARWGHHGFRLASRRGVSNLLLFRVGDLPHQLEHESNNDCSQAEELVLPVTVNARMNFNGDFDFYRFHIEARETWVFDLRAARNGNGLDAGLMLLDKHCQRLASSEDGLAWDPFLVYAFPAEGVYYAVVRPNHDGGVDPSFAYQLDIRTSPHLSTIVPLSFPPGSTREATVFGDALLHGPAELWFDQPGFDGEVIELAGDRARILVKMPDDATSGPYRVALITTGGRSNIATFLVDATPIHSSGDKLLPPISVLGIAKYPEPQRFFFDAMPNQVIDFEISANRFGSKMDSVLRILDEGGSELARSDDAEFTGFAPNRDALISYKFDKAGVYELQVSSLWEPIGEAYPYHLRVASPRPKVDLSLGADTVSVPAGTTASLQVKAVRRGGFEGAIPVVVQDLPEGLTVKPVEISAGSNQETILFCAENVEPGIHREVLVTSPSATGPATKMVRVSSDGGVADTFVRVDAVTVAVVESPRFSLNPVLSTLRLIRGRSVAVPVQITRAHGFDGKIKFSFDNLPSGVIAEPSVADGGAKEIELLLRADGNADVATHTQVIIVGRPEGGPTEVAPQVTLTVE